MKRVRKRGVVALKKALMWAKWRLAKMVVGSCNGCSWGNVREMLAARFLCMIYSLGYWFVNKRKRLLALVGLIESEGAAT